MASQQFDYIIVGAGSAGCVLASRLSDDPAVSVLLLEAGTRDDDLFVRMPAGWAKMVDDDNYVDKHVSLPEPGNAGRLQTIPRGRLLGGSSAVNGMLYVRGQCEDYDGWASAGATGWDWNSVRPYFLRSENHLQLDNQYHGKNGPLSVSIPATPNPIGAHIIQAFHSAGFPLNDDCNGATQEGVGYYHTNIRDNERCSCARAFLDPVRRRPNLSIVSGALAEQVLVENGVATGIAYRRGNQSVRATARREVLLAAGAMESPKLLMLSGIGPGADLQRIGITVKLDVPGVGANLQDHMVVPMMWRLKPGSPSANRQLHGLPLIWSVLRYLTSHQGPMVMAAAEVFAFVRSDPSEPRPDIQFHCLPITGGFKPDGTPEKKPDPWPGVSMAPYQMNPDARGRLSLRSRDARDLPVFSLNYLSSQHDQRVTLAAMRIAIRVAQQPALAALVESIWRPDECLVSDAELLGFAAKYGTTGHHPVGTCRMGSDAEAVVDPQLRVRGIAKLRVIDASVMPVLTSGNTHAPTVMIAERAVDLIRGRIQH